MHIYYPTKLKALIVVLIVIAVLGVIRSWSLNANAQTDQVTYTASSTTFTLTTTSQRLLATTSKRVSSTVQPVDCTAGGTVYLNFDKDAPATASNGYAIYASTTATFSREALTETNFATQGILDSGTCTVLVTEWIPSF
jgi:hypothetical protein